MNKTQYPGFPDKCESVCLQVSCLNEPGTSDGKRKASILQSIDPSTVQTCSLVNYNTIMFTPLRQNICIQTANSIVCSSGLQIVIHLIMQIDGVRRGHIGAIDASSHINEVTELFVCSES
jgi:hypothetical protein